MSRLRASKLCRGRRRCCDAHYCVYKRMREPEVREQDLLPKVDELGVRKALQESTTSQQRHQEKLLMLREEVQSVTLEKERIKAVWRHRLRHCQDQLRMKEEEMKKQCEYFELYKQKQQHKLRLAGERERCLRKRIGELEREMADLMATSAGVSEGTKPIGEPERCPPGGPATLNGAQEKKEHKEIKEQTALPEESEEQGNDNNGLLERGSPAAETRARPQELEERLSGLQIRRREAAFADCSSQTDATAGDELLQPLRAAALDPTGSKAKQMPCTAFEASAEPCASRSCSWEGPRGGTVLPLLPLNSRRVPEIPQSSRRGGVKQSSELQKEKTQADIATAPLKAKLANVIQKCRERNGLIVRMAQVLWSCGHVDVALMQEAEDVVNDASLLEYSSTFFPGEDSKLAGDGTSLSDVDASLGCRLRVPPTRCCPSPRRPRALLSTPPLSAGEGMRVVGLAGSDVRLVEENRLVQARFPEETEEPGSGQSPRLTGPEKILALHRRLQQAHCSNYENLSFPGCSPWQRRGGSPPSGSLPRPELASHLCDAPEAAQGTSARHRKEEGSRRSLGRREAWPRTSGLLGGGRRWAVESEQSHRVQVFRPHGRRHGLICGLPSFVPPSVHLAPLCFHSTAKDETPGRVALRSKAHLNRDAPHDRNCGNT